MEGLAKSALFAGRFQIEHATGAGGMGTVYRAHDLDSQRPVALKLLHSVSAAAHDSDRFLREAQLLAELHHPGIVSHVAHGQTADGQRYLAMEWLDGEDLSKRLQRGLLTLHEAVSVLRQVTDALAAAHERGVIHRDIKPSNLFLKAGDLGCIKLLDFGIARRIAASQVMTRTGLVIGTPEYMAPEQARGERDITPSADFFSLGCVIYECLAGQPPFAGEHIAAVLTRILFESPPDLRLRRPDVPDALRSLLDRMLAKQPVLRHFNAAALAGEIAQLGDSTADNSPLMLMSSTAVTLGEAFAYAEQELLCVVIAGVPCQFLTEQPATDLQTTHAEQPFRDALVQSLRELGARAEWLLDGSLIATLSGQGSATDQAARAARAALLIKARWPAALTALSTGRATVQGNLPVGEAVDRGARLLRLLAERTAVAEGESQSGIWLDELSAGLLARCFNLTSRHGIWLLSGEEWVADDGQLLLGKPTPCIGREQELGMLELSLTSCIEESTAEVVLITAPTGVGKSRLGREFLRRTALRATPITVMLGRSDMISCGSPYAILRDALRRLCELGRGPGAETQEAQREKVRARLGAHLPPTVKARLVAFLGELCGVPFADDELPILRAARNDPKIMSDQLAETLLDFFRAECGQAPVLLFLEDFQWADVLTVKLTTLALRELSELPLLIVALARPEVHEVFPKLWSGLRVREIMLNGLSKKASERLIQQALGRSVPTEILARIIDRAAGNTLFLEELIRVVATGDERLLPATVLAMLQARIGQLDNSARRVLRAGSVFGQTFWFGGLRAVLHHDGVTQDLDSALRRLVDAELIESRPDSRLPGEAEYGFRHALVRDAAYSLLTEEDLGIGHRRAGEFLERAGEVDALVLAEHFANAKEFVRAAEHYLRAGLQSFECNDLDGALCRAERGIACAPSGQTLGELRTLRAMAHCWRSELVPAFAQSTAALPLMRRGSRAECSVLFHGLWAALVTGHEAEFLDFVTRMVAFQPDAEARRELVLWASLGASLLTSYGRRQFAQALLNRAQDAAASLTQVDLDLHGAILVGRSDYIRAFEADPWSPLLLSRAATEAFEQIGDRRDQITAMNRLGQAQSELGDFASGERTLRSAAALARRIRVPFAVLQTELHLAALLCNVTASALQAEAARIAEATLSAPGVSTGYKGWCLGILACIALRQHQPEVAITQARASLELCARVPLRRLWVLTLLTRGLTQLGRGAEARACATDLLTALAELGGAGYAEVGARLAASDGFLCDGATDRAAAAREEARNQLALRIAQIPEPTWREHYISDIEENARLMTGLPAQ